MSNNIDKYQKRRLITSYVSVTVSISLVLLLMGLLGLLVFNASKLANHFKEKIAISIYLKEDASQTEIQSLQRKFSMSPYVKTSEFISKDEAAIKYSADIGENFVEFLGYNPLKDAVDISLKAQYVNQNAIERIVNDLQESLVVEEVSYDKPLIQLIDQNIQNASFWLLISSICFTIISVLLINSSIRLSIYSKRFIIKTMQMVGATKSFIQKPFIWTNIKLGIYGATISSVILILLLNTIDLNFPEIDIFGDVFGLSVLFISLYGLGILISYLSTQSATQRFLNLRTDRLYYE
ncbi:MAG: permease-like cell division protein FtsX [Flavobacteriaceae bacterium]|jgi:cell division transport system permease protein